MCPYYIYSRYKVSDAVDVWVHWKDLENAVFTICLAYHKDGFYSDIMPNTEEGNPFTVNCILSNVPQWILVKQL